MKKTQKNQGLYLQNDSGFSCCWPLNTVSVNSYTLGVHVCVCVRVSVQVCFIQPVFLVLLFT